MADAAQVAPVVAESLLSEDQATLVAKLIQASSVGDNALVQSLLESGGEDIITLAQDETTGRTPLHAACQNGHLEVVQALLEAGHPWNVVDSQYRSAGEEAKQNGHTQVYEAMLEWGIRVEFILSALGQQDSESEDSMETDGKNAEGSAAKPYLSQKLHYSDDGTKLLDAQERGVMMSWEKPLMLKHAKLLCHKEGLDVLNVGFGLGLVDEALQTYKPKTHTIIEAHPDVYAQMIKLGWDKKQGVRILFGRWQDVADKLETYDAIYWDTFGEEYKDQKGFHEIVAQVLRPTGVFSFFNGLGGNNVFFHDVYCRIVELEFSSMGMSVEYLPMDFEATSERQNVWDGVSHKYWTLKKYNLPMIRWKSN